MLQRLSPPLALASPGVEGALSQALTALCADGGDLSTGAMVHWEDPAGWSAHSLPLLRSEQRDCALYEERIVVSVGIQPGSAPVYRLQASLPPTQTPIGDCQAPARSASETVVDGDDSAVRLVLQTVREGEAVIHSRLAVRRATPTGWREQILAEPAAPRLLGGFEGRKWSLAQHDDEWLVVASQGRTGTAAACVAEGGQTVWTWSGEHWTPHSGSTGRTLLAQRGLWRHAGDPGWLLILVQRTEDDADLLRPTMNRLQRHNPSPLLTLHSSDFPELNAGLVVVSPPPFADEASARAAGADWRRKTTQYVKRAWPAPDPCQEQ